VRRVSTPTPKDVVRRFLDDAWDREANRWNVDVVAECFDVDRYFSHTWEADLVETGRRQGEFFRSFGRERQVLHDVLVADGDHVVHSVTYRTTVDGTVLGIEGSGRSVTLTHIEMWRVEGGKIVEHRGGIGEAQHLYTQLTS
jgi:hypothetical protein